MSSVAVLIPVLGRPARAAPVAESVLLSDERAVPFFLCSPDDRDELAACAATDAEVIVVSWPPDGGDYARKMNSGYRLVREEYEWVFLGADDLVFHPGWLDACLAVYEQTDACVIGTNDLGNGLVVAGHHSTHSLVHRDYLECGTVDEPGRILCELYDHNYVDTEFIETAMWRGTFAPARDALVEHLHPFWAKGSDDATYEKGRRAYAVDQNLFRSRQHLWGQGRPQYRLLSP